MGTRGTCRAATRLTPLRLETKTLAVLLAQLWLLCMAVAVLVAGFGLAACGGDNDALNTLMVPDTVGGPWLLSQG